MDNPFRPQDVKLVNYNSNKESDKLGDISRRMYNLHGKEYQKGYTPKSYSDILKKPDHYSDHLVKKDTYSDHLKGPKGYRDAFRNN